MKIEILVLEEILFSVITKAPSMFHLNVMNKNVADFHKSVVTTLKTHTILDSVTHIFAVGMKTTGAISLKI